MTELTTPTTRSITIPQTITPGPPVTISDLTTTKTLSGQFCTYFINMPGQEPQHVTRRFVRNDELAVFGLESESIENGLTLLNEYLCKR